MAQESFLLSALLEDRLARERSLAALSRAINVANGHDENAPAIVDRRKLKQIIVADEKLVLSQRELRALDCYLRQFGPGLTMPLFVQPDNVVKKLVQTEGVAFLLGAKPEVADFRVNFSHWDVMAMAEVQREGYRHSSTTHFDIHDVLLHDNLADARKACERSPWIGHFDDRGPSLVCLASTRALHATELMLSRMFEVQPFDPAKCAQMPFHFVWPVNLANVLPSCFHRTAEEAGLHPDGRALEVRHGGKTEVLADTFTQPSGGETYGILVVQRRRGGKLWICLAGVSGLGTLAAARTVRDMVVSFTPDPEARNSPVSWQPVRAQVRVHPNSPPGRVYELADWKLLGEGPHRWPE